MWHKSFSEFYEDFLIFKDQILLDNFIDQLNNFCKKKI